MYGKIFDSMYDGTLADDWRALITFQQMIVLCDADGVVDMTASSISRRTGIPIEHIKAGIEILENADPYSRTPDEEGRRIMRLDNDRPWGWYLVNHEKYRKFQDADTIRAENRERKRRQRQREKDASQNVTGGHDSSQTVTPESRHTDTDTVNTTPNGVVSTSACPHQEILNAYRETLPELRQPQAKRWNGSQASKHLQARWREDKQHQSIDWWREFFHVVRTNDWWMGRDKWKGADLRWLVKRENFDKVVEHWENQAEAA